MTPLRFRAWDTETHRFIPCHAGLWIMVSDSDQQPGDMPVYVRSEDSPSVVVMQSTGLTDKNGKEIFEGDILKWLTGGATTTKDGTFESWYTFSVEWDDYISGTGEYDDWVAAGFPFKYPPRECEVIGNIWENPELLSPDPR